MSVLVLNWNGRELLRRNLPHVLAMSHPSYEVVVVDNGSTDGSVALVREEFPRVRLLALPVNRGFTGGNNAGLTVARGEFIATLNNDARPEPDWLQRLAEGMNRPDVGVCASKLIVEGRAMIDSAGDEFTTVFTTDKRGSMGPVDRYGMAEEVFGACAGAALYRRTMLEAIGFFDDGFFLVFEDIDLSFRARLAGWKVCFAPRAVVHHAWSSTLDRIPDVHHHMRYRNMEYVWIKNVPGRLLLRHAAGVLADRLLDAVEAWRRLRGGFRVFLRAKRDVIRNLPRLLAKRRKIQRARKATVDEIERALKHVPVGRFSFWRERLQHALRW